ncbi:MAG: transposase [Deltaproteobacteria bacterium]|nr:transposase [Deltaproteobacteria bacterium]
MVCDGASSHTSKDLHVPRNISIIKLPPYSPELNHAEQIWRVLKDRYFANLYFETLDIAIFVRPALKNIRSASGHRINASGRVITSLMSQPSACGQMTRKKFFPENAETDNAHA